MTTRVIVQRGLGRQKMLRFRLPTVNIIHIITNVIHNYCCVRPFGAWHVFRSITTTPKPFSQPLHINILYTVGMEVDGRYTFVWCVYGIQSRNSGNGAYIFQKKGSMANPFPCHWTVNTSRNLWNHKKIYLNHRKWPRCLLL